LRQSGFYELYRREFVIDFVRAVIGIEGELAVEDRPNVTVIPIPYLIIDRFGSLSKPPLRVQSSLTGLSSIHLKVTPRCQRLKYNRHYI